MLFKLTEKYLKTRQKNERDRRIKQAQIIARLGGVALESTDVTNPEGVRKLLDNYSIAPRIPGHKGEQFIATKTFREGNVGFGEETNNDTGRIIFPNMGACLVVSLRGGDVASVYNVVVKPNQGTGKGAPTFTRRTVSGLYSDSPTVSPTEIIEAPFFTIDAKSGIDFIKVARRGFGKETRNTDVLPEQLVPAGAINPAELHELTFMATAINLISSQSQIS